MTKPTGKLKHAYETIFNMESIINELKANKPDELTIDKCIKYLVKNADKFNEDNNTKFAELHLYLLVTNDD